MEAERFDLISFIKVNHLGLVDNWDFEEKCKKWNTREEYVKVLKSYEILSDFPYRIL
jgi:hypothetical protein